MDTTHLKSFDQLPPLHSQIMFLGRSAVLVVAIPLLGP